MKGIIKKILKEEFNEFDDFSFLDWSDDIWTTTPNDLSFLDGKTFKLGVDHNGKPFNSGDRIFKFKFDPQRCSSQVVIIYDPKKKEGGDNGAKWNWFDFRNNFIEGVWVLLD